MTQESEASRVAGYPKHANLLANNPSPSLRTGRAFWKKKLTGNKQRDRYVTRQLRRQGWTVVRIWEHELGSGSSQKVIERIQQALGDQLRPTLHGRVSCS